MLKKSKGKKQGKPAERTLERRVKRFLKTPEMDDPATAQRRKGGLFPRLTDEEQRLFRKI
ncbi:MAG: hypothetical protein WCW02_01765 [Candidatus Buchananbacteria bacterium]